jgi:hypothetical protein
MKAAVYDENTQARNASPTPSAFGISPKYPKQVEVPSLREKTPLCEGMPKIGRGVE